MRHYFFPKKWKPKPTEARRATVQVFLDFPSIRS
jgi:hypothetical protein